MIGLSTRNALRRSLHASKCGNSLPSLSATRPFSTTFAVATTEAGPSRTDRRESARRHSNHFSSKRTPGNNASTGYNARLEEFRVRGSLDGVFQVLLDMKRSGIPPSIETYHSLLQVCSQFTLGNEAMAFLADMDAVGIRPTVETYKYLLQSTEYSTTLFQKIIDRMEAAGIEYDAGVYHRIIKHAVSLNGIEIALQELERMHSLGLKPLDATIKIIITAATNIGLPRLASDIADVIELRSVKPLSIHTWAAILRGSADSYFMDGVEKGWDKAVRKGSIIPEEGLCIQILNCAGRHGKAAFAKEVLEVLEQKVIKAKLEEHHLAPLLEAFCFHKELPEALGVFDLMRQHKIEPTVHTCEPLVQAIAHDAQDVDRAFFLLEERSKEGTLTQIAAFNAVMKAAVELGDLQRAIGIYKEVAKLGAEPNLETFTVLLTGCIKARHAELGDYLLEELKTRGFTPNEAIYERMIVLSLTQTTYESAFFYLEEMKSRGFVPSIRVYTSLAQRCGQARDARAELVLEEMREHKYTISDRLREIVQGGTVKKYNTKAANRTGQAGEKRGMRKEKTQRETDNSLPQDSVPPKSTQPHHV